MTIKIWPWNLLFGINAGIKYQGPDQIYDIFFKTVAIMPDNSEPGLLCLLTSIEIPELFKGHLRPKPLKLKWLQQEIARYYPS
jgi:hypothetical protein